MAWELVTRFQNLTLMCLANFTKKSTFSNSLTTQNINWGSHIINSFGNLTSLCLMKVKLLHSEHWKLMRGHYRGRGSAQKDYRHYKQHRYGNWKVPEQLQEIRHVLPHFYRKQTLKDTKVLL